MFKPINTILIRKKTGIPLQTRVLVSECKETKPGEGIVHWQELAILVDTGRDRLKITQGRIQKMVFWDFIKDLTPPAVIKPWSKDIIVSAFSFI